MGLTRLAARPTLNLRRDARTRKQSNSWTVWPSCHRMTVLTAQTPALRTVARMNLATSARSRDG